MELLEGERERERWGTQAKGSSPVREESPVTEVGNQLLLQ
jgi:hypothetical protein